MPKLFVFDLDDTLIDNVHDYAEPILNGCREIIRVLGNKAPHVSKIVEMEQATDERRVKEINPLTGKPYLFSMERFPGTLVEVYREICKKAGVRPEKATEENLYNIGLTAFDESRYRQNINPQAVPVLSFLKVQGDILYLYTKGDSGVQEKKVRALTLACESDYFSEIFYVNEKTADFFRDCTLLFPGHTHYSVGNSYASDIKPALEAGFQGIFIPVETWDVLGKMAAIVAEVDRSRCIVLKNLVELTHCYGELK